MVKENTIDNWILGGTVFLVIFTLGCYLWFQNQMSILQSDGEFHKVEMQQSDESTEIERKKTYKTENEDTEQLDSYENISNDDYSDLTSEFFTKQHNNFKSKGIKKEIT